jgi:hypothetical protein
MWNWKLLYEDKDFLCYCDIDSINNPEEDDNGIYTSVECYQATPGRVAAWLSFFIKDKEAVAAYIAERQRAGLPTDGYQNFNNTLCVVELNAENGTYRVIPAVDYDSKGVELGPSTALDEAGRALFKGSLKSEWAPIQKRKTHKAIHALVRFVYG